MQHMDFESFKMFSMFYKMDICCRFRKSFYHKVFIEAGHDKMRRSIKRNVTIIPCSLLPQDKTVSRF